MDLSIIVPFYNEEESVVPLYQSIMAALDPLGLDYELIFVDDGSADTTAAKARQLAEHDGRLRILILRRNFGQTPAMAAGIDYASGEILVTMDGDLQNDPMDIPVLIKQIQSGCDIAVGWRQKRQDKLITRRIPSRIANWLIGKVTGVPIRDNGCSLKAYRAHLIKGVPLYSEMHRFIPAMASISGARVVEVGVRHHPRRFGLSKYGLSRLYKVLLDLLAIKTLMSCAQRPIAWFGLLAIGPLLFSALSIGSGVYLASIGGQNAFPLASLGVLLGALAVFLVTAGFLAELLLYTGDDETRRVPSLTAEQVFLPTVPKGLAQKQERGTDA